MAILEKSIGCWLKFDTLQYSPVTLQNIQKVSIRRTIMHLAFFFKNLINIIIIIIFASQ